jgi:hypothetical protein
MFFRGNTDNGAILNAPEGRIAIPILQTRAVKDTDIPYMVLEIERSRLAKIDRLHQLLNLSLGLSGT